MVQVLPYIPGFGERIGPHIAEFAKDIGAGIQKKGAHKAFQEFENARTGANNQASPMGQVNETMANNPPPPLSPMKIAQGRTLAEASLGKEGADAWERGVLQEQKLQQKEQADIRKEERALLQPGTQDYFKKIASDRTKLPEVQLANDFIIDAIKSGEVDPFSQAHIGEIAKDFGVNESILKSLEGVGSKEFKTAKKTFLSNTIKDTFKGTTTKTEINLAEEMLADVGVSREGNLAAAWGVQAKIDIDKERVRLTDQLLEEGVSPSKVPSVVDKMIQPYVKETKDQYFEALRSLRKKK